MLRVTIKDLQGIIDQKNERIADLEETVISFRKAVWSDIWHQHSVSEAISRISTLQDYRRRTEGAVNQTIDCLRRECARLWWIVRVYSGDPTVQTPDQQPECSADQFGKERPPFDRARFNG